MQDFDSWYEKNRSYYAVKHSGNEDDMKRDALRAFETIRTSAGAPQKQERKSKKKAKPNPYGFDK